MALLTDTEIDAALGELTGWERNGDALTKTFEFDTFGDAIDFMARLVPAIDEMDHHPEWTNVYNRVEVRLSSHDAKGITGRDVSLAHALEDANA